MIALLIVMVLNNHHRRGRQIVSSSFSESLLSSHIIIALGGSNLKLGPDSNHALLTRNHQLIGDSNCPKWA